MKGQPSGILAVLATYCLMGWTSPPIEGTISFGHPSQSRSAHSSNRLWFVELFVVESPARLAEPSSATRPDRSPKRPLLFASLYAIAPRGEATRISTFPLQETPLPEKTVVSDDGATLVLLNALPTGNGTQEQDAVYLYQTDGTRIGSLRFDELLTREDLAHLQLWSPRYQIPWEEATIDAVRGALQLRIDRRLPERDLGERPSALLEVDLATGKPRQPPRHLLPHPLARLVEAEGPFPELGPGPREDGSSCTAAWENENRSAGYRQVALDALRAHAEDAPPPVYNELARRARIAGLVVVEARIAGDGRVEAACLLKDLPMRLGRTVLETVQGWRFRPFLQLGRPATVVARVAFELGWFLEEAETSASVTPPRPLARP